MLRSSLRKDFSDGNIFYSDINNSLQILFSMYISFKTFPEVRKVLSKLSKLKGFDIITDWIQPCINHLHWSATTTFSGDGNLILAKFKSFLGHIVNKHKDLQSVTKLLSHPRKK